ncbi:TIR domain-containing protein [Devosia beringensis]|uniref:TIR domain-containing protein n=1 Tax=Devosia beringensis TaxID=2657486 RepID=UPI00186B6C5E|nr:TIR domain-containing protein [Devosia beringensis]
MSGLNLLALVAEIEAEEQRRRNAIAVALMRPSLPRPVNTLSFLNGIPAPPSPPPRNALAEALGHQTAKPPMKPLSFWGGITADTAIPPLPTIKRSVFYSFHYGDVIRVNNVRHAEQFKAKILEVPQSHYDRSLWENSERTNPDSLKQLIREGVKNTSVTCVLIGSNTWLRPWVRYEIARSVIEGKGLLAVDINSINHHKDRYPHPLGPNPLAYMAVGKMQDGTFRLFEKNMRVVDEQRHWSWDRYANYTLAVPLPKYLPEPAIGYVIPLDHGVFRYDARRDDVWKNMPAWLNLAAVRAGRQ